MRLGWWLLAGLLSAPLSAHAVDPSVLWKIVNGQCVPHEESAHDPSPCSVVDIAAGVDKGYAVLKDIRGIAQYLLIPTGRIGGIEDKAILAPGETNYWQAAWQARSLVEQRLNKPLPRDAMSLAINSAVGRTQDQLHIHIDCVRPDVRDTLAANLDRISDTWGPFPLPLAGNMYRAIRINGPALDGVDPFRVLYDSEPGGVADMGLHTLVATGATFPGGIDGFVLLDNHADLPLDRASGEELQDHSCAVAAKQ